MSLQRKIPAQLGDLPFLFCYFFVRTHLIIFGFFLVQRLLYGVRIERNCPVIITHHIRMNVCYF